MLSKYSSKEALTPKHIKRHEDSLQNGDSGLGSSLANSAFNTGESLRTSADSAPRDVGYGNFLSEAEVVTRSLVSLPIPRIDGYDTEEKRLETMVNWPVEHIVKAREVAHAGLISTGNADRAKCVFCLGTMYNWEENDDPIQEHVKHFKECALMKYFIDVALKSKLAFFSPVKHSDNVYPVSYVSHNWLSLASVGLVLKLGYSESCVSKAKVIFLRRQKTTVLKYFARELLDVVAELEDEEEKVDQVGAQMATVSIAKPNTQKVRYFASAKVAVQKPPGAQNVLEEDHDSLLDGSSVDNQN